MQPCMSQNRLTGAPPSLSSTCSALNWAPAAALVILCRERTWVNGWTVPWKTKYTESQIRRRGSKNGKNLKAYHKDKHRRRGCFSSWEVKGSAHTEVAACEPKRNDLRCSASEDWVKQRHISTNVELIFSPAFSALIQRNQNTLGPVCVRLCESQRVYLTSQLAVMTHCRLYLWQESSLFARHSGSPWFIGGQTAAQDDDVTCLWVCIKHSVCNSAHFSVCWFNQRIERDSFMCSSIHQSMYKSTSHILSQGWTSFLTGGQQFEGHHWNQWLVLVSHLNGGRNTEQRMSKTCFNVNWND